MMNTSENPHEIKAGIMTQLMTRWNIDPIYRDQLESHYLLSWSGEYFSNLWYTHSGKIHHQDKEYQIIFHNCLARDCITARTVWLSFRKYSKIYPYGYVLVTPADKESIEQIRKEKKAGEI